MTLKPAVESPKLKRLHKQLQAAMTRLTNEQRKTKRTVAELGRTIDRFIRSLEGRAANGHGKPPKHLR